VDSQVAWKVASPYAQKRGYTGSEGWKHLYRDYRQVTDQCVQSLSIPTIAIDTSAGEWISYQKRICAALNLPLIPEPGWQRWFYKIFDTLVDIRYRSTLSLL
jgi:hypothetical protein